MMASFRIDSIADLARQMAFTPAETRLTQLAAAEDLLYLLDPSRAYPLDFVIFRITGYHPRLSGGDLLTGMALLHDLGLLIEHVSQTLDLSVASTAQPVLGIEQVCERFNVTSKSIQRWRRRGLAARHFLFPDGKRRVGFLLSSVERYLSQHRESIPTDLSVVEPDAAEVALVIDHARSLVARPGCCQDELSHRLGRRFRRSPLAILHVLRKHDADNPAEAILPRVAARLERPQWAIRKFRRGHSLRSIARRLGCSRRAVYFAILSDRAQRLSRRRDRFIDDPLYHQPDAAAAVAAIAAADGLDAVPTREESRIPRNLPPFLQDLYRTPLLGPARERALFIEFNFHRYQFATARRRLDPELARNRDLKLLENLWRKVADTRNQIVSANLRLVVSVARRHLAGSVSLPELISEGGLTLMRAVDGFDTHRGHRFSTYATLALMKGFARSVGRSRMHSPAGLDEFALGQLPDRRSAGTPDAIADREHLQHLLSRLDDRERRIVAAHFGLGEDQPATYEQVGQRLGLSKHRVRQIEQDALAKLRRADS